MMIIFKKKNFFLLLLFISAFTLISAIYIEFFLEQKPCELCIFQRYPYLFAILVSFFGYFYSKTNFFLYIAILTFLISALLSGYHIGVEQDIFTGLASCSSDNLNIIDKNKLLNSLEDISVSCKDSFFTILGMSLATVNLIISIIIIVFGLKILKNEKNR